MLQCRVSRTSHQVCCSAGAAATGGAMFGQGTGPVWSYYIDCDGREQHLMYCSGRSRGSSYLFGHRSQCSHAYDAGVICDHFHNCKHPKTSIPAHNNLWCVCVRVSMCVCVRACVSACAKINVKYCFRVRCVNLCFTPYQNVE